MDQVITLKEIAAELHIKPKSLRKRLRDNEIPKPGSRWEWEPNHPDLQLILSWKSRKSETRTKKLETKQSKTTEQFKTTEQSKTANPKPEVIQLKSWRKDGKGWALLQNSKGHLKAAYIGPKTNDQTPWISNESQIRPSLPKYLKEAIKEALQ